MVKEKDSLEKIISETKAKLKSLEKSKVLLEGQEKSCELNMIILSL